ncbi:DUF4395 domain-containing protein [Metabacillus idriensis]|uniref:DUF4395 domain-containing protein n=1 Tax=Metabacillus idriensis TaxID=324768 RepID=UPI003D2E8A3D
MNTIPKPLVLTNQWFIVLSVAAAWMTGSGWFLLLPLTAGLMGLLFKFNPIMKTAKLFLRKKPSEYLPEDFDQQQFNQLIAVICLSLGFLGYMMSWMTLAYIFTVMVALAAFVAILGFCVGCFIRFQWQQYRYRRLSKQS